MHEFTCKKEKEKACMFFLIFYLFFWGGWGGGVVGLVEEELGDKIGSCRCLVH